MSNWSQGLVAGPFRLASMACDNGSPLSSTCVMIPSRPTRKVAGTSVDGVRLGGGFRGVSEDVGPGGSVVKQEPSHRCEDLFWIRLLAGHILAERIEVDADHDEAFVAIGVVELAKVWECRDARRRPTGPEIDQDHLTLVVGETYGLAVGRQFPQTTVRACRPWRSGRGDGRNNFSPSGRDVCFG